ncbi:IS3 family transposase [Chryseobacterium lactis]|uniref:IS3 family transposase n=1 Tax=Chryseobacterium lactis TaxID=1241981 RepID=UPI0021AB4E0A|nr:IS3 family transposase [Chryseobacterium lactis]
MKHQELKREKRTQRDYSIAFKLGVVSQVENGDYTYKQAQKEYGIQGRSTVLVWLRRYGNLEWSKPKLHTMHNSKETPAQKIKRLERELADEKLKTKVLNMMIDLSDKQYGTQIRKKFSSQQSFKLHRQEISISRLCRLFGISRQAIYQARQRILIRENELLKVKFLVQEIRMKLPKLGTRKLYYLLKEQLIKEGIKLGRDALFAYLKREKMLICRQKKYIKTTFSKHWLRKHPNLLKNLKVEKTEQVFVSDITYLKTRASTCYLSLVTDAYSRKIMGYSLSTNMNTENVAKALKMAIKNRVSSDPLIHHSDRGLQYCSGYYQKILNNNGIKPSMTDGYDCYQNAMAERVNGILKQEFLFSKTKNIQDLNSLVKESIYLYNTERPHLSLNMETPDKVHKKSEEIKYLSGLNIV